MLIRNIILFASSPFIAIGIIIGFIIESIRTGILGGSNILHNAVQEEVECRLKSNGSGD